MRNYTKVFKEAVSLGWLLLPILFVLIYMHVRVLSVTEVPLTGEYRMLRAGVSVLFDTLLLGEAGLIVCLGRRRIAYGLLSIVSLLWCFVNIIYAFYFKTYLALTAVAEADQLGELSMYTYMSNALCLYDLIPITIVLLPFLINRAGKLNIWQKGGHDRLILAVPLLLMVSYFVSLKLFVEEGRFVVPNKRTFNQISLIAPEVYLNLTPVLETYQFGVFRAQLFPYVFRNTHRELSEEEIARIGQYLEVLNDSRQDSCGLSDFVGQKNLILIVAETYLAASAEAVVDGREVTPFLNSLRRDSSVVFNDSVRQNTELGGSSDGQYIYMTGLIPLKSDLTVSVAKDKKFITLPSMLKQKGYQTLMTNPSQAEIWNQSTMCRVYGIDEHYALAEPGDDWKTDQQMFACAIVNEEKTASPFFHLMLTISTHSPFDKADPELEKCSCCPKSKPEGMSPEYFHYLQKCHYMDHALQGYFESLRQRGLYDSSVIVIASDHGWQEDKNLLPLGVDPERLSCMIIGAPMQLPYHHTAINQIDVFTSVVDLMGIDTAKRSGPCAWKGLGRSIFRPESFRHSIVDESRTIAADILYGDYFRYGFMTAE